MRSRSTLVRVPVAKCRHVADPAKRRRHATHPDEGDKGVKGCVGQGLEDSTSATLKLITRINTVLNFRQVQSSAESQLFTIHINCNNLRK